MSGQVRHKAVRAADGAKQLARLNVAGEGVETPWILQQTLEGNVFYAGTGVAEAGVDGIGAADEQTPTFAIVAPPGGKVIIPIWARFYFDTEGGAAPSMLLNCVQATKGAYDAGTSMPSINALGGANPKTAQGRLINTLSALTAYVAAENVVLTERTNMLDNFISEQTITPAANLAYSHQETPGDGGNYLELNIDFLTRFPLALHEGSFVAFNAVTGTTDSKYNVSACWVELDSTVYKP